MELQDYLSAFKMTRKHKLNQNILVDLNIDQFLDYISKGQILKDFKSSELEQLISDLNDEFSFELKYIFTESELTEIRSKVLGLLKGGSKLNLVLSKLENVLKGTPNLGPS